MLRKAPFIDRSAGSLVSTDDDNLRMDGTTVIDSMSLVNSGDRLTLSQAVSSVATVLSANANTASAPSNIDVPTTVTVAAGATVEIDGVSAQSVTFAGETGTLKIDHSIAFKGLVSGLSGADALDLADISFGTGTSATFLGNTAGGALTVTDGTHTANIALRGDYLSSSWTLSSDGMGGTLVVDPVVVNPSDGSANAPANTPQLPTLLSSYAARPTWNVAGVDYAVGYASGTALRDPSTISMAGVSVDNVTHVLNIAGNNVTLSGYDFSLNGGWGVSVNTGSNITIQNSKFIVGSNGNTPIYVSPSASNVTIEKNLIDGAGTGTGGSTHTQVLVAADGTGTTTIQYNLIENAWGQNIVMSSDVGGENWVVQYNVIKNAGEGYNSGAHGDWIQTYNLPGANTSSFLLDYNTFVQTDAIAVGRTQGISAFSANSGPTSGGVQTESFNNNTFIANNGSYVNYAIILDTARLIGTATIQNNYFDTTNIGSANGGGGNYEYVGPYNGSSDGPYHGTVTQSNNVNMVAGTYLGQSGQPPVVAAPVAWNVTTGVLASAPAPAPAVASAPAPASAVDFSSLTESSSKIVTIQGTADAYSQVKLYDGTTSLGTASTAADGTWTFTTPSAVSDTLHTFTAQEVDSTGHVVATSSGAAIMAASNTSTLTGTGGNDFLFSSSSNLSDTFVFTSNLAHSTIEGFTAAGSGHDTIQFSKSVFDSFASVLAHATQAGQDVVISADASNAVTLKNTKLGDLSTADFHFA